MTDAPPERFVIVLDARPNGVPAGRRVARLLKYAGRALDLRCVEASTGAGAASSDEVLALRKTVEGLAARVAVQAELLKRAAERLGGRPDGLTRPTAAAE